MEAHSALSAPQLSERQTQSTRSGESPGVHGRQGAGCVEAAVQADAGAAWQAGGGVVGASLGCVHAGGGAGGQRWGWRQVEGRAGVLVCPTEAGVGAAGTGGPPCLCLLSLPCSLEGSTSQYFCYDVYVYLTYTLNFKIVFEYLVCFFVLEKY